MKHLKQIIWFLFCSVLLSACGGNPAWDGHKSEILSEQIAEEACKCVYQIMSEDDRFDMATMIEELDAEKPSPEDLVKGEILKKMPETVKALMLEEEISLKLDASDCMKPIENKAFNSGVDFEDWMEVLDKHCKLGIFYN